MTDYSKPENVSLSELKTRIRSTDLVPSRVMLIEGLESAFEKFSQRGILTWLDLRKCIQNSKHLEDFANETGISLQYLVLLRRETESYQSKPFLIKDVHWISNDIIAKIIGNGITDSEMLLAQIIETKQIDEFAGNVGIDCETVEHLVKLAKLCRVQWVSPTTARMIIEAGFETCQELACADAGELYKAMARINNNGKFFRGTIGMRDTKRLIEAAKYNC